ncbi:MAG: transporter substrate-binding domain-containing protein [Acidisphaera sp.]|nr:transporter substrate-binding domain-containing protein [Acidisphaera sp.]MBV9811335.1 transporter substrate-binding domain-containing protein [Acetobacteraceae bacterium]
MRSAFLGRNFLAARLFCVLAAVLWLGAGSAAAKDWKTVRFGMDASYAPFESVTPSGDIVGFEVDYGRAICAKLNLTCAFQNQDWDGIIPSLLANKFDVIFSSMNITDERKKRVIFSDVYYATPPVFAGPASDKSNDVSPAALKGKSIGTQSSTIHANFLERFYKDSDIKLYPTQDEPNLDLASGRLDFVVGDIFAEKDFIEKKGNGCCRIIAQIQRVPGIHGPGVGAAFRPEDTDLRDLFNKAIAELDADGSYKKIEAKYFQEDIRGK